MIALVALVIAMPRVVSSIGDSEEAATGDPLANNPVPQIPVGVGRIGNEVVDESLAFIVSSVDCQAREVTGGPSTRTAQGKFCFVSLSIRNLGRAPITFQGRAQMLADSQNRRIGPDAAATSAHPGNAGRDLLAPVVNPGNELKGVLVFDVPPEVTLTGVSLRAGPTGRGAYVSLT